MPLTPHPLENGFLVVFEGIDGSGKTTQLELAQSELQKQGWPALYATRNLGGTPIGEALREVILSPAERPHTTNLYISVAIQEALAADIKAKRAEKRLILMDRGPISLAAYEIYGDSLDPDLGWPHVDEGMKQLQPDLMILYKTDVTLALERARQKNGKADYFESKPQSYFEKVSQGYEDAVQRYQGTCKIIDGNQPVEAVHEQTMRAIMDALSRRA